MEHKSIIQKVKAVAYNFYIYVAAAAATAALEFTGTVDWEGFGIFGPAAGLAVAGGLDWLRSYWTKSKPEDFEPTPTPPAS